MTQASYAALAVQTREFLIITMWIGQIACELLNWVIKRIIKEERPIGISFVPQLEKDGVADSCSNLGSVGNGYGFPSSHSQYMAYFATFLICHLYLRHRFSSTGYTFLDRLWRMVVYIGVLAWAGLVAYSRYASFLVFIFTYDILISRVAGITSDTTTRARSYGG